MRAKLQQLYGNIDIYLFDQLLKGTYDDANGIDAGCGGGTKFGLLPAKMAMMFMVNRPKSNAVEGGKIVAKTLHRQSLRSFSIATAENLPFDDEHFDLVDIQC